MASPFQIPNVRLFIWFRVLFGARFYYPIFTILFLDLGVSLDQFALLNVAWAASIILLEVPSGALADIIGRRNLVVAAAGMMIFEMAVLCLAPVGSSPLLFSLLLLNRIASGAAEAAASGADEALAYDSLAEAGDAADWPRVLERQMHATSIAFVVSSTIGAAVYDPDLMQKVFRALGGTAELTQALTLRFPIVLCLLAAIAAFFTALRMKDVKSPDTPDLRICKEDILCTLREATRMTMKTGRWILQTPIALVIILTGVTFDSMIRLFLTLSSQYYRVIQLPEASFGVIGSALSLLGLIIPGWAKTLTQTRSPRFNVLVMTVLAWLGIWGLTFGMPYLGLLPVIPLFAAFFLLMFFMSHYLNRITDASQRATVLSFRGLVFNLGYAGIGILYSVLVSFRRPGVVAENPAAEESLLEDLVFVDAMQYWPWYFLATLALTAAFATWSLRGSSFLGSAPPARAGAIEEEEKITN
jgi:MFS family permease